MGMNTAKHESRLRTYFAATATFTPAASATDIFVIGGAADKAIRLLRLALSGVQTTAGNVGNVAVVRRSTANTAGTAVAATKVESDQLSPKAASAVVQHYTANPTTGTLLGKLWNEGVLIPQASSVASRKIFDLDFTKDQNLGLWLLRGAAEQIAINLGGTTPTGAAEFQVSLAWTEQ